MSKENTIYTVRSKGPDGQMQVRLVTLNEGDAKQYAQSICECEGIPAEMLSESVVAKAHKCT